MRTMRTALAQIDNPSLAHEMQQFCAQEGQHYQQHARANEIILSIMPDTQRQMMLAKLEEIAAAYRAFSTEKPLQWNLAYAEGFEAYTAAGARTQMELRVFDYMQDPIRDLMLWHIMEELEHRTVAFDAYQALGNGYLYGLRVGLWAQRHFVELGRQLAAIMQRAFPQLMQAHDNEAARRIRRQHRSAYTRRTLKNLAGIYTPWYSPRRYAMPPMYEEARTEYNQRALSAAT